MDTGLGSLLFRRVHKGINGKNAYEELINLALNSGMEERWVSYIQKVGCNFMQQVQNRIKENIRELINLGEVNGATKLIEEYAKTSIVDIEIFSMKAVIAIMQMQLQTAEDILQQGLIIDPFCFDLLYNLAYVYEQQGHYCQALISYRKARRAISYDIGLRNLVDARVIDIYSKKRDSIKKEQSNNVIYKNLNLIKTVLFIQNNLEIETNRIAKILYEYGIDVDLHAGGDRPSLTFEEGDLSYRKITGNNDINGLMEYINYNQYDIIHIFPSARSIQQDINSLSVATIVDFPLMENEINIKAILDIYVQAKERKSIRRIKVEDLSKLTKDVTIIIPTYNRIIYLERVISFLNAFEGEGLQVIVLDSSYTELRKINKEKCRQFDNLSLRFFEFDDIDFLTKLNYGIDQVKTKYLCFCADDDFILEEGIIRSLEVLNEREELFSVKGKNLSYVKTMAKLEEYDSFNGLYDSDPLLRLEKVVKGFVPSLIYQVFRTREIKIIYSFLNENKSLLPENATFQEYLIYFMVLLTGRVGKVNVDFNIRDKGAQRANEVKNFHHAVLDGTFNDNYQSFKEFLKGYGEVLGIPSKKILKSMDDFFSDFLINSLKIPKEHVYQVNGEFDLDKLDIGMRKSWG